MLDYCRNIVDLSPLEEKFKTFGWETGVIDGHNMESVYNSLKNLKGEKSDKPGSFNSRHHQRQGRSAA